MKSQQLFHPLRISHSNEHFSTAFYLLHSQILQCEIDLCESEKESWEKVTIKIIFFLNFLSSSATNCSHLVHTPTSTDAELKKKVGIIFKLTWLVSVYLHNICVWIWLKSISSSAKLNFIRDSPDYVYHG